MKRVMAIALAVVLSISGCSNNDDNEKSEIPNPASVYCEEQAGTVDIRTDVDGGQVGYCVFDDGTEVEAYFRNEAEPVVPN